MDEQKKKAHTITTETGLANNSISSIIEDDSGIYWVSTVSGISRIELKETSEGYDFHSQLQFRRRIAGRKVL